LALEHPEHDGADKGERKIRGNNAQLAGESHGKPPWFSSQVVVTHEASNAFPPEKVSLAALFAGSGSAAGSATWLKTREINALKSP
jgi:hypothetical protein